MNLLRLLLPLQPTLLGLLPEAQRGPRKLARRWALHAELVAAVAILLLTAFGFAVAASYMALAASLTPHTAAAIVALGLCLLAGGAAGILYAINRKSAQRRAEAMQAARERALLPVQELGRQIGRQPLQSVLIAAAAGVVLSWLGRRR